MLKYDSAKISSLSGGKDASSIFRRAGVSGGIRPFSSFTKATQRGGHDRQNLPTLFYVGLMGLFTAYYHVFRPIEASASIGWSTSPYEYEVGMADLMVGVLGVLCLVFRDGFWLATAIAEAVWLLGDAVGHIKQMVVHNNHAENNAGIFLVFELAMPVLILALMFYYRRLNGNYSRAR